MLRKIFLLIICILLFGGCILQSQYLKDSSHALRSLLAQVQESHYTHNEDQTEKIYTKLYTQWEERANILISLLPHQQLDDIYLELAHLKCLLTGGDEAELSYSFEQLDYLFTHLTKTDMFSFGNIF